MPFRYSITIVMLFMILALSRGFVLQNFSELSPFTVLHALADDGGGGDGGGGDGGGGDGGGGDGGGGDGGVVDGGATPPDDTVVDSGSDSGGDTAAAVSECILSVFPSEITLGESTMLSWGYSSDITSLTIDNGVGVVTSRSFTSLSPVTTTTYTATALDGAVTCSATVTVNAAPSNTEPTGNFDSADCNMVSGWAYDPDASGTSIQVHLYKDGPYGVGTIVGGFTADYPRPDVNAFLGVPGNYGFFFPTPDAVKDDFSHDLYVYAIDSSGGTNPLLGGSPITIPACNGTPPPPPPTCTLTAVPTTIQAGGSSTIYWTQENATDFAIDQGIGNIFFWNVAPIPSGSFSVSPAVTTTYTGTVHDHGGFSPQRTGECTVTITVTSSPPPPPPPTPLPATIRVDKVVVNDNGGTKAIADFPLFVSNLPVVSGAVNSFNPGTYVISETNLPGYTSSISGECDPAGNLTVEAGQNKICTITNNDIAVPVQPTIKVIKVVVNDNDGTKVVSDFPLSVDWSAPIDRVTILYRLFLNRDPEPGGYAFWTNQLIAGSATITEAGWFLVTSQEFINTNGQSLETYSPDAFVTFLYTTIFGRTPDDAGKAFWLNELNSGSRTRVQIFGNFLLSAESQAHNPILFQTTSSGTSAVVQPRPVTSNEVNSFDPGTYTVSETNQSGYTAAFSGDCSATGAITVAAGENKVCTITNDDTAGPPICTLTPSLTVIQTGSSSVLSWTATNATSFVINQGIGSVTPVAAGSRTVSPTATTTYTGTATNAAGTSVTCTAQVAVSPTPPGPQAPVCTLTASLTAITTGSSSVLSWTTSNTNTFTIDQGIGSVTPVTAGSTTTSPTVTTTYTGTAAGAGGTITCSAQVTVTPPVITGCTSNCGGGGGGGGGSSPKPKVVLSAVPHVGQVLGSYLYLSQIPYTGLELGSIGTTLYWLALILWALALAYVVLFGAVPFASRSARSFGARVSNALNAQELRTAPARMPEPVPVMAVMPEPREARHIESVFDEAPRGYSSYEGFKSFAKNGALSIDDIVKGLARVPAAASAEAESHTAPANVEPIYENVEPIAADIAPDTVPVSAPAHTRGFIAALVEGDREAVFAGLRQHVRGGGTPEQLISPIVCLLDDAYRARVDGTACDADMVRLTARLSTPTLEKLIAGLTNAIDSSYSTGVTGAKLALTRALAVLGA